MRLCLDFEDASLATTARDLSPFGNDAHTHVVTPTPRGVEQAAKLGQTSSIHIADVAALDLPGAFTFEMFVDPADLTSDSVLFHNSREYGIGLVGGQVYCNLGEMYTTAPDASGNLVAGRFQHVACSYDGTVMRTYVEGAQVGCQYIRRRRDRILLRPRALER